ncbi:MAG: CDP-diacylglycerol--serine O-phosphatidyltransferase [Alphaproteobacteria bacterium]|nr:CDP-diacylglycerol--serine O-phosphatidyltransferase [Alphaproteobacteria bacterium]
MLKRRRFRRVPRLKGQTFNRLVPNIITVGALSAGLTAIRFAFEGRWQFAVTAILVAAVLDALDGRMARLLKSASDFGAELDSLSDVIAFGVAPAIVVYLWVLSGVEGPGWIAVLFFTVCCALRLARFNTSIDKLPPYAYNYFTGVPAPAGAGLAILPMIASFEFGPAIAANPIFVGVWMVLVGGTMVSRLPTYSFKKLKIPQNYVLVVLVAAGLVVAGLASAPWRTLLVVGVLYLVTIPFASMSYLRLRREAERLHDDSDDAPDQDEDGDEGGSGEGETTTPHLRPV